jgi:hypothetical protein
MARRLSSIWTGTLVVLAAYALFAGAAFYLFASDVAGDEVGGAAYLLMSLPWAPVVFGRMGELIPRGASRSAQLWLMSIPMWMNALSILMIGLLLSWLPRAARPNDPAP